MKSTLLLMTALFLMSAPSPDSKSVSEFSAGFLSETSDLGLMAAEPVSSSPADQVALALSADQPAMERSTVAIEAMEQPQAVCITSEQDC